MSWPGYATLESFRYAAQQLHEAFDEYQTSGGGRKYYLHLLSRFNSDQASIFLVDFLREMLERPSPFHEQVAAMRLRRIFAPDEAFAAIRALNDFGLLVRQDDPSGGEAVYYKVHDQLRENLGIRERPHHEPKDVFVHGYAVIHGDYRVAHYRRPTGRLLALWATAFRWLLGIFRPPTVDSRNRSVTEVQILGASIDRTTDSFNEILNLLGPPPESSDNQPVTPPTVPAGVS